MSGQAGEPDAATAEPSEDVSSPSERAGKWRHITPTSAFLLVALVVSLLGILHFFLLGALSPWPVWENPYNLAVYTDRAWLMQVIGPGLMGLVVAGGLLFAAVKLRSIGLAALGAWVVLTYLFGVLGAALAERTLEPAWELLANGRYLAQSVLGAAISLADMLALVAAAFLVVRDLAMRTSGDLSKDRK